MLRTSAPLIGALGLIMHLPMDELLTNLSSPSWWIGVVVVSFVINLASAYVKEPMDRAIARFSARRRDKLARAHGDLVAMLEAAKRQENGFVLLAIQELKFAFVGVSVVTLCILVLLTLQASPSTLALPLVLLIPLLLFLAFYCLRRASKIASVLRLHEKNQPTHDA